MASRDITILATRTSRRVRKKSASKRATVSTLKSCCQRSICTAIPITKSITTKVRSTLSCRFRRSINPGNPVYIVASFESSGDGDNALIGGARVQKALGSLTIGANGVIEQQQPVNYTLLGTDAKYVVGKQLTLSGELARSNDQTGDGYAYKVESAITPLSEVTINGYYRKSILRS